MDSGMANTGTGASEGHRVDAIAFRGCQALTPETETSTHYFCSRPHNFSFNNPEVTKRVDEEQRMPQADVKHLVALPRTRV